MALMGYSKTFQLHYSTYGDPHLPAVVLLMGLGMPAAAWPRQFVGRLVKKGLYVIAPDNRDCGASELGVDSVSRFGVVKSIVKYVAGGTVRSPYRLEDMAADTEALLDRAGVSRAHVVGISLGGMIAQVLACQAPHRVMSLTSISSASGNPRTGLGQWSAIRAVLKEPPKEPTDEAIRSYLLRVMGAIGTKKERYTEEDVNDVVQVLKENRTPPQAAMRQLLAILGSGDRRRQLRQLTLPTLVIHGTKDPLLPFAAGKEVAECIEGAKLLPIDGMGHDLPRSRQELIAEAIAAHCYR